MRRPTFLGHLADLSLRPHITRRHKPGLAPGELTPVEHAHPTRIRVMAYGPEGCEERFLEDPAQIRGFMGRGRACWIDIEGLADLEVLRGIGRELKLHDLALEDVVNGGQRAKLESYAENIFIVIHMAHLHPRLEIEQLSLFHGPGWVLSVQERPGDCLEPLRERIRHSRGRFRRDDADYLLYAIIDAVIDHYFPLIEHFEGRIEAIEQSIIRHNPADSHGVIAAAHGIKQNLRTLHRTLWPLQGVLESMVRDEELPIRAHNRPYLRDSLDHVHRLLDLLTTYVELGSDLMNLQVSMAGHHMNSIMKVLTIIASIFIPITFIAGIYGMNFDPGASRWNMPELAMRFGYPGALGAMALVAVGMVLYFRRKGWF